MFDDELAIDVNTDFAAAVAAGLSQSPKVVPARYFYDRRGSELFEEITELAEYYPTRTEIGLLERYGRDIAKLTGEGRVVVEFGSGSSRKTPLLLANVSPAAYVPIDISAEFLDASSRALSDAYPGLDVLPVATDFTRVLALPDAVAASPKLGFFPGSTIGNMGPSAAIDLLRGFRETLGNDAWLVIGIDLRKDTRVLERAYDDAQGVTAAFNLNLLHRINRELDGDCPVEAFEHRAVWNEPFSRIEMHLVASRALSFHATGRRFSFRCGESIHTENSHKYSLEQTSLMARASGWEARQVWMDAEGLYSLQAWRANSDVLEP